jgi:hypothetical protein
VPATSGRPPQPGQQPPLQSVPPPTAPSPRPASGTRDNRVGQNQAGQAEGPADASAADSRKLAARRENDRFKAAGRREDGADRLGGSYDQNATGTGAAAQRAQAAPNTPNGDRAGADRLNINRSPMDDAGSADDGDGPGHEVGRDASRAATTRSANASRVADQTNSNQTDKDRTAMKNR